MEFPVGREVLKARLVVVGSDTVDAAPGLMLVLDDRSYMINCGEGTQRLCEEYKIRLPKLAHVFFSRMHWRVVGGFPGMLLTMSDIGGEQLGVHGPPGTLNFLCSLRYFVKRPDLLLSVSDGGVQFDDGSVSVRSFELEPSIAPAAVRDEVLEEENVDEIEIHSGWVRRQGPSRYHMILGKRRAPGAVKPPKQQKKFGPREIRVSPEDSEPLPRLCVKGKPRGIVSCFELKLADVRGKFDVEKAKALGIPPGRSYSELVKGVAVKSPSGRVVTPQECLGPNVRGPTVLVIDCPHETYAEALLQNEQLQSALQRADYVFHFTCASVFLNPRYAAWISRYASVQNVQHFALNECSEQGPVFFSAYGVQSALAMVEPLVFRMPSCNPRPHFDCPSWARTCRIGDTLVLAPEKLRSYERGAVDENALRTARERAAQPELPVESQFGFLGTGASRPSKYRNVTSQFVRIPGVGLTLFDCGEGTLGQLWRLHGAHLNRVLANLRCIFVSHLHADHHLGLTSLLSAAATAAAASEQHAGGGGEGIPPLLVVGPAPLGFWIDEMKEWHSPPAIGCAWRDQSVDCNRVPEDFCASLGLLHFSPVHVIHCPLAFGFVIEWKDERCTSSNGKFRFVYSGDTRPCFALEEEGRDADLLIHEATFEDSMQDDAENKRHCTISEARDSGDRMNAKCVVLTHFSQRYPKAVTETGPHPVALAWDLMCFDMSHFSHLASVSSLARNVFPVEEDDEK